MFPKVPDGSRPRTVEDLRVATQTVQTQAQAAAEEALGHQRHVQELEMQQKVGTDPSSHVVETICIYIYMCIVVNINK